MALSNRLVMRQGQSLVMTPQDTAFDAIGSGVEEGRAAAGQASVVSKGLVRSKSDKLMLVPSPVKIAPSVARYETAGANALKGQLQGFEEPALPTLGWAAPSVSEKRAEARMKGYVGENCPECGNFTMVRNGTCLKCETCGATTGCS